MVINCFQKRFLEKCIAKLFFFSPPPPPRLFQDDPSLSKGRAQDGTFISAALLIKCKSWHVLFSGNSDVVLSEGGIWTTTNLFFVHVADEMKIISVIAVMQSWCGVPKMCK